MHFRLVFLSAVVVLLLSGCGVTCDQWGIDVGCTDSEVVVDTNTRTNPVVADRVLNTILHLQDIQERDMRDEHGFFLPKNEHGFAEQGDAIFFQAHHLVAMCQQTDAHRRGVEVGGVTIFTDPRNDKSAHIAAGWEAMKRVQTDGGRIFRHPLPKYKNGTSTSGSISNDVLAALYYLAANAHYYECDPIAREMGSYLHRFAEYAVEHEGELGVGTTSESTKMKDWLPLHHLLLLYGES